MAQAAPQHAPPVKKAAVVVGEEGVLLVPLADPAPDDNKPRPTIGVAGKPIEDGERDPDTIAEEQRRRSEEYEANLTKNAPKQTENLPPPPAQHTSKK